MTSPLVPDARTTVDPRGPRFGASITVVVLAAALITAGSTFGLVLIAWQTLVFGLGAFIGLYAQPYGVVFRKLICPRLTPPTELEDAAPPRFAQLVGFAFLAVALVATLAGAPSVAIVAVGFALGAAFLNAAFNFCLGCEMYLISKRVLVRA
ncbi:MAG: DUF4395 family protein [Actinobacteria bacterium]|uniref:Unannotated protein n=1 Tax=freshwater metagenome TaxID=449393 RepID=A0A6J7HR94_9ZZZZ|nr:DUF4395 family protein [Actinomycetota bacterium]